MIVRTRLPGHDYPITIENRPDFRDLRGREMIVISNPVIARLHKTRLDRFLGRVPWVMIPDGEHAKSLTVADRVFTSLIRLRAERDTTIVAIGGGVVGDLAGFVAATYLRGVPFVQVPTSLLAMVDSSVGGKVGVNHPLGKNQIGAFYHPESVRIDLSFLKTLPDREMICGLAEILKYGFILDRKFLFWIAAHQKKLLARDQTTLSYVIRRSCERKSYVVRRDERESGLRMILNFGHTWAHALETIGEYRVIKHGEAVMLGMLTAAHLSAVTESLSSKEFECAVEILKPHVERITNHAAVKSMIRNLRWPSVQTAIRSDKKNKRKKTRWVLLEKLGSARVVENIPEQAVRESLAFLRSIA